MYFIKVCNESDLDALCVLEGEASQTDYSAEIMAGMLKDSDYIVLGMEADKLMAGYLAARLCGDEAEIHNIAVLKEYRRRGIGAKLIGQLFKVCAGKGAEKIFLEVAESNAAAIALYEKSGFKAIGKRSNYYGAESALLMEAIC